MTRTPIRFGNAAAPAESTRRSDMLGEVHREMADMVGLRTVKDELDRIVSFARLKKLRRDRNLPSPPISMHMVFRGPPGTGKTEVARKIARILFSIRFIKRPDVVEVDRSTITSQFANETPKVVASKVKEAIGGVLFIDEAYTLAGSSALNATPDKAGKEAIDTLMKAMEDNRESLVVICAGYTAQMDQFLDSNPGLKSRFGFFIDFPNYSPVELRQIFDGLVKQYQYQLTPEASQEVNNMLGDMEKSANRNDFGNAREVRQKFERIAMAQAARVGLNDDLDALTEDQLLTLERDDIEAAQ